jgi:hypothetical protein
VELAGAPVGGGLLDCGACPGDKASPSPQSSMQQIVFIVCLLMQAHASPSLYASFLPF